ncbi:SurA N-terminal domain-containing protein [Evansella sp. AB-P1]|uniref:SurA N-terminal domain-containing protein n=1 Tax=Evansella sp. AB-P1 TaxID=3037653 RepID=UPI00241CF626|nr:SurA N-terminal domain-containing protein [Evansella sp. AB-P1]MDG5787645.1 SurA N-terminal domain-containing protein [Evansella sp. AB-P1]
MMRRNLVIVVTFLTLLLLAACGGNNESDGNSNNEVEVVATINGENIYRSDLHEEALRDYGIDLSDDQNAELAPQLEPMVLSDMIDRHLLVQEAERQNITIDSEEVDVYFEQMKEQASSQLPEGMTFEEALEMDNLTEEMLREDIRSSLKIERLLEFNHLEDDAFIAVSEEEVQDYYDQWAAEDEDLDDYEVLQAPIENYLRQVNFLESLHDNADIETFI